MEAVWQAVFHFVCQAMSAMIEIRWCRTWEAHTVSRVTHHPQPTSSQHSLLLKTRVTLYWHETTWCGRLMPIAG